MIMTEEIYVHNNLNRCKRFVPLISITIHTSEYQDIVMVAEESYIVNRTG